MEPNLTTPAAEALCVRMMSGTDTPRKRLTVLWIGKHVALVHRAASSYSDNGGRNYVPGHIDIVEVLDPQARRGHDVYDWREFVRTFREPAGKQALFPEAPATKTLHERLGGPPLGEVHSCSTESNLHSSVNGLPHGRATPKVIAALIERAAVVEGLWPVMQQAFQEMQQKRAAEKVADQEQEQRSQARADLRKAAEDRYKAHLETISDVEKEAADWIRGVNRSEVSDLHIAKRVEDFAARLLALDAKTKALGEATS